MKHRGTRAASGVTHDGNGSDRGSLRECVVCRTEKPRQELLRLSWHRGVVGLGRGERGRGAHVCTTRACLAQLSGRVLTRAFKAATEIDAASFMTELHAIAEAKVLELVGLSRRQGALAFGVDGLKTTPAAAEGGFVLIAADLSERAARHAPRGTVFVTGLRLGKAAGMGYLGAVRLPPGPLSDQAAYWVSLWYESQPPAPESLRGGAGTVDANATPVQTRCEVA